MADSVSAPAGIGRLAHQLQLLSELCESLTVRLLELEERVVSLDQQLQPLRAARSADTAQSAEEAALRLDDTEHRLNRLEGLLAGIQSPPASLEPADSSWHDLPQEEPIDEVETPLFLDEQQGEAFLDEDFEDEQRLIA